MPPSSHRSPSLVMSHFSLSLALVASVMFVMSANSGVGAAGEQQSEPNPLHLPSLESTDAPDCKGCTGTVFHLTDDCLCFCDLPFPARLLSERGAMSATERTGSRAPHNPSDRRQYRIGVLAKRGDGKCRSRWTPMAEHLTRQLRGHSFSVVPLDFSEIDDVVGEAKVDFVLANPAVFVRLNVAHDVSQLATLTTVLTTHNRPCTRFGGVVFCRTDSPDIHDLKDLRGRSVAGVAPNSLGGWLAAARELKAVGIDPSADLGSLTFAGTHDAVVRLVREGEVAAGTVRTDTLETLQREGKIRLDNYRVLPPPSPADGFPFLQSTRLYPEWPMAALPHVPRDLAQSVAVTLFDMQGEQCPPGVAGWSTPHSYQPVQDCLKELGVAPYENHGHRTLGQLLAEYWPWLAGGGLFAMATFLLALKFMAMNRRIRRTAHSLRASRQRLRATLHSIGDGVISTDASGRVVDMNPVAESLTEWSVDGARGKDVESVFNIVHGKTGQPVPNPVERVLETGEVVGLANDTVLIGRESSERQIADSAAPIRDRRGDIIGAVLVFRDVTRQYRQREKLRQSERKFRQIFNNANDAMFLHSVDDNGMPGRFVEVNRVACERLGYSREELLNMSPRQLDGPDGADLEEIMSPLVETGHVTFESVHLASDGSRIPVEISSHLFVMGGQERILSVARDITERRKTEKQLQTSLTHIRELTESITDILWTRHVDQDGNVMEESITGQVDELLGLESGTIGDSFEKYFSYIHPDDRHLMAERLREAAGNPALIDEAEYRVITSSGETRWCHSKGRSKRLSDGTVKLYGRTSDITRRKRVERQLRESRQRMKLALRGGGLGTWDWDLQEDRVQFDERWARMKGYGPDEVDNTFAAWEKMVHPEDLPRVMEALDAHLEGRTDFYESEFRMRHKSGHWVWVLDRGQVIKCTEDGTPLRMCGTHLDITEQKRTERSLQDKNRALVGEQRKMQSIFDTAPVAMLLLDQDLNVKQVNTTAAQLAARPRREMTGCQPGDALCCHHASVSRDGCGTAEACLECQIRSACDSVIEDGEEVRDIEAHFRPRDDGPPSTMYLSAHATPIRMEGQPHVLLAMVDITERKKAEKELKALNSHLEHQTALANSMAAEAESANQAKSQFLANMSHEIRTPLNGVLGMTSLLLDTDLDDEQRHYADTARASGETLLNLINDILDFSKIEAGKLEMETVDFDLGELLDEFADAMAIRAVEKNLEFMCAADPDVPKKLRGDPERLRQILTNLVGNAIKFTGEGEVTLRAHLEEETESESIIRFSVKDTGIGIPEHRQDQLFDSFSQVDASTTRKFGGTGLGLAISRQLTEMMGGEIGVNSREGDGSEFWFTAHLEKQDCPASSEITPDLDLAESRVLVVDDNDTNREILRQQLASHNIDVDETPTPSAALEKLRAAHDTASAFSAVILDMQMPGMDGEDLARAIRNDARIADIPLVLMSSVSNRDKMQSVRENHVDACLIKPVRPSKLFSCLESVIGDNGQQCDVSPDSSRERVTEVPARNSGHVLVAEDNPTNQQVTEGMLRKLGMSAEVVDNGRAVLETLETGQYDLVLMDVQMPKMDGYEATRQIRESSDDLPSDIPIIAMTAHAMKGDCEACLDAGMDDYLAKPVSADEMGEVLQKWLRDEPSEDDAREEKPDPPEYDREAVVLFDEEAVLDRVLGDRDLAEQVVRSFLDDVPGQIEQLREHIRARDARSAERQAHSIKGAAGNVGALTLQARAKKLEELGASGDTAGMKREIDEFEEDFDNVRAVMKESIK